MKIESIAIGSILFDSDSVFNVDDVVSAKNLSIKIKAWGRIDRKF